jgi:hypothetical protein
MCLCSLLEDPRAETVDNVAKMLGLERVGMLYSHPPRHETTSRAFSVSASEVYRAAQVQAEAGPKAPFVTVKVTADSEGSVHTEAFSVTDQGCEMVVRDAIAPRKEEEVRPVVVRTVGGDMVTVTEDPGAAASAALGRSISGRAKAAAVPSEGEVADDAEAAPRDDWEHQFAIDSKFQCMVEGKPAKVLDVEMVLANVAIAQASYFLYSRFPRQSRLDHELDLTDFATHMKMHSKRFGYEDAMRDFELLVFMASQEVLVPSLSGIADCVLDPEASLSEDTKALLATLIEAA